MKNMTFSEMLKHMLRETGMTQKQLANKLNISEDNVSRYISGQRQPRAERFRKIIDALGYRIVYVKKRPNCGTEEET